MSKLVFSFKMPIEELRKFADECGEVLNQKRINLPDEFFHFPSKLQTTEILKQENSKEPAARCVTHLMYCALSTAFAFKTIKQMEDFDFFDSYLTHPNGDPLSIEGRGIVALQNYIYTKQSALIGLYHILESEIRRMIDDHSSFKPKSKKETYKETVNDLLKKSDESSITTLQNFANKIQEKFFCSDFIEINRYMKCLKLNPKDAEHFADIKKIRDSAHDGHFDANGSEIVFDMNEFPEILRKSLQLILNIEKIIKAEPAVRNA